MADLVQGAKVKKAYYKAIRIAHPDRHQTGSVEQQYIASWVLDMLKLSWEKFKSVEGFRCSITVVEKSGAKLPMPTFYVVGQRPAP